MNSETTMREKYDPIFRVTTEAEARAHFEQCVAHTMAFHDRPRAEAEAIERQNIAYYAGYGSHEDRLRVERLFGCVHPVFGAACDGAPTPEEALRKGREYTP